MTRYRTGSFGVAAVMMVALGIVVGAQEPPKADATEFRRSDPSLLNATGRPQLIEFFHPQ
jgi:hypothetical protein